MKKFLIALGIIAVILAGAVIFKNTIIKSVLTRAASNTLGATVHIDAVSWNYSNSNILISGFTLYNPAGFSEGKLLFCSQITAVYDRATLFKKKRHFLIVKVELKTMEITRNREGKLNVDSLKIVRDAKSSPPTPVQIDLLTLSIGKIVYKDYTKGAKPAVHEYDVNKHKTFKGVPTLQQLIIMVLAEPMKAAAIRSAEIYGVAMLIGVPALPISVAVTFLGRDSVRQIVDVSYEHTYGVCLEVLKSMGSVTKDDPKDGEIKAHMHGSTVTLHIKKKAVNKTEIIISARKYMFPNLSIAGGVLYQVLDKLQ